MEFNLGKFKIIFINDQDQLKKEANTNSPPILVLVTLERCSISTVPKMTEDSLVSFHMLNQNQTVLISLNHFTI